MASPLTIQPDGSAGKDTYIDQDSPTTNRGTGTYVVWGGQSSSLVREPLIQFDLSGVPSAAMVSSTVLNFPYTPNQWDAAVGWTATLTAYRMLRAWTEAGATWLTCDGTNNWGTAGAKNTTSDREASSIGSATYTCYQAFSMNLDAAKVQEWVSGSFANNGLLLLASVYTWRIGMASSDNATPSYRPNLVVAYTEGGLPPHLLRPIYLPRGIVL